MAVKTKKIPISELGFDLKTERKKRGLSQWDVTVALALNYQTYRSWELNHTYAVPEPMFLRLKEFFTSSENFKPKSTIEFSSLGFDLKEERLKYGYSQTYMAERLGVAKQTYQNWESKTTKSLQPDKYQILKQIFEIEDDVIEK